MESSFDCGASFDVLLGFPRLPLNLRKPQSLSIHGGLCNHLLLILKIPTPPNMMCYISGGRFSIRGWER